MPTYRIKTEKEFLKEFGDDWSFKVELTWATGMNYLHNKIVNFEELPARIDDWNISKDMVVLVKNPILKMDLFLLKELVISGGKCTGIQCHQCPIHTSVSTKVCTTSKVLLIAKILLDIRNKLEGK